MPTTIDLTHLQAIAAAGEASNDPEILAQVEALVGQVLRGGASVVLNRYDFYPTPPEVIRTALDSLAEVNYTPERILEPSCGTGAWLDELISRWPEARIDVVERNPLNRAVLRERTDVNLVGDDFLTYSPAYGYDLIVGNPPFGDDTDKLAWASHLEHAREMLTARGQMMMVAPAGITFRNDKPIKRLRDTFKTMDLPAGSFKESGTGVNVVLAWHSPDKSLEPRFRLPKVAIKEDAPPQEKPLTPQEVAQSLRRSMRYVDRIIDRVLAPPKQKPIDWNDEGFQGLANYITWYAYTAVAQNQHSSEAMQHLFSGFTGSRATKAAKLREYYPAFCRSTGVSLSMNQALRDLEVTWDDIDWEDLVRQYETDLGELKRYGVELA